MSKNKIKIALQLFINQFKDETKKDERFLKVIIREFLQKKDINNNNNNNNNYYCISNYNHLELILFYLIYFHKSPFEDKIKIKNENENESFNTMLILNPKDFIFSKKILNVDYPKVKERFLKNSKIFFIEKKKDIEDVLSLITSETPPKKTILIVSIKMIEKSVNKILQSEHIEDDFDYNTIIELIDYSDLFFVDETLKDFHENLYNDEDIYYILSDNVIFQNNIFYDIMKLSSDYLKIEKLNDSQYLKKYGLKNAIENILSLQVIKSVPVFDVIKFYRIRLSVELVNALKKINTVFYKNIVNEIKEIKNIKIFDQNKNFLKSGSSKNNELDYFIISLTNEIVKFIKASEMFWFDPDDAISLMENLLPSKKEYRNTIKEVSKSLGVWMDKNPLKHEKLFESKMDEALDTKDLFIPQKFSKVIDIIKKEVLIFNESDNDLKIIVVPDIKINNLINYSKKILKKEIESEMKEFVTLNIKEEKNNELFEKIFNFIKTPKTLEDFTKNIYEKGKVLVILTNNQFKNFVSSACPKIRSRLTEIHLFVNKYLYSPVYQQNLFHLFSERVIPNVNVYFGDNIIETVMSTFIAKRKNIVFQELNTKPYSWSTLSTILLPLIKIDNLVYFEDFITTNCIYDTKNLMPNEYLKLVSLEMNDKSLIPYILPNSYEGFEFDPKDWFFKFEKKQERKLGENFRNFFYKTILITNEDIEGLVELLHFFISQKEENKTMQSIENNVINLLFLLLNYLSEEELEYKKMKIAEDPVMKKLYSISEFKKEKFKKINNILNKISEIWSIPKIQLLKITKKEDEEIEFMKILNRYFINPQLLIVLSITTGSSTIGAEFSQRTFFMRLHHWYELYGELHQHSELAKVIEEIREFILSKIGNRSMLVATPLKENYVKYF